MLHEMAKVCFTDSCIQGASGCCSGLLKLIIHRIRLRWSGTMTKHRISISAIYVARGKSAIVSGRHGGKYFFEKMEQKDIS